MTSAAYLEGSVFGARQIGCAGAVVRNASPGALTAAIEAAGRVEPVAGL